MQQLQLLKLCILDSLQKIFISVIRYEKQCLPRNRMNLCFEGSLSLSLSVDFRRFGCFTLSISDAVSAPLSRLRLIAVAHKPIAEVSRDLITFSSTACNSGRSWFSVTGRSWLSPCRSCLVAFDDFLELPSRKASPFFCFLVSFVAEFDIQQ